MNIKTHKIIILIFITLFIITNILSFKFGGFNFALIYMGANIPKLTMGGEYHRLFISILLHGSLLHLFFNSYAMLQIGNIIETNFSSRIFMFVFIVTGIFSSLLTNIYYGIFLNQPEILSVGASGGIFGLIGFLLAGNISGVKHTIKIEENKKYIYEIDRNSLIINIIINILIGLTIPFVNNVAHISGLVFGIILGITFVKVTK